jgi:hypothetical protein
MSEKPEKEQKILYTRLIFKLHPKLITIGVKSGLDGETITVNLPINDSVYNDMLLNLGRGDIKRHYPLVFIIDDKGTATKVRPYRLYEEEQAKSETEKETAFHAHQKPVCGRQDTPKSTSETQIDPENTPKHPL